jgi:hypothetical protein
MTAGRVPSPFPFLCRTKYTHTFRADAADFAEMMRNAQHSSQPSPAARGEQPTSAAEAHQGAPGPRCKPDDRARRRAPADGGGTAPSGATAQGKRHVGAPGAGSSGDTVWVIPRADGSQMGSTPLALTLDKISSLTYMRLPDAAKSIGISVTTLKHVCRKLGLSRWPRRTLETSQTEEAGAMGGAQGTASLPGTMSALAPVRNLSAAHFLVHSTAPESSSTSEGESSAQHHLVDDRCASAGASAAHRDYQDADTDASCASSEDAADTLTQMNTLLHRVKQHVDRRRTQHQEGQQQQHMELQQSQQTWHQQQSYQQQRRQTVADFNQGTHSGRFAATSAPSSSLPMTPSTTTIPNAYPLGVTAGAAEEGRGEASMEGDTIEFSEEMFETPFVDPFACNFDARIQLYLAEPLVAYTHTHILSPPPS